LKLYNLKIFVLILSLSFSLFTKADTSENLCLDDKNKYFNNFSENIMPKKISLRSNCKKKQINKIHTS